MAGKPIHPSPPLEIVTLKRRHLYKMKPGESIIVSTPAHSCTGTLYQVGLYGTARRIEVIFEERVYTLTLVTVLGVRDRMKYEKFCENVRG